jgi:bifunctional DNase/RNase
MKKKELKILGLSYSQSQVGSYILILSDRSGLRKLPLIIKPFEAQKIAIELEGIKSNRPLTYDIVKNMCDSFSLDIQEVFIYSFTEGIFYTKIIFSNGLEEVEIESTVGDAIALATIFKCDIYTTIDILERAGIIINDDGTVPQESELDFIDEDRDDVDDPDRRRIISVENLEKMMSEAIANEDYEVAAELRDRIQAIKDSGI